MSEDTQKVIYRAIAHDWEPLVRELGGWHTQPGMTIDDLLTKQAATLANAGFTEWPPTNSDRHVPS